MSDQVREAFCDCVQFEQWYDGVCHCGHRDVDHIDGVRSCVGDVTIISPVRADS